MGLKLVKVEIETLVESASRKAVKPS